MASLAKCGFVALDGMYWWDAIALAERLRGHVYGIKVNDLLDGDMSPREVIGRLKALGFKVFADTKYKDIPTTTANRVKRMAQNGADLITVHASGGAEMVKAAVEAYTSAGVRDMQDGGKPGLGILAVTVLTSIDIIECDRIYGAGCLDVSKDFAEVASNQGVFGVVCSTWATEDIKQKAFPNLKLCVAGIRLVGEPHNPQDDHASTDTPANALKDGADFLVIGREITLAADPLEAIRRINSTIAHLP